MVCLNETRVLAGMPEIHGSRDPDTGAGNWLKRRLMDIRLNSVVRVGVVTALAIALYAPNVLSQTSQGQNEERFQRSFPMNAGGSLVVENRKGTIHVMGSDTRQVIVSVTKRFVGGSDKDRESWMNGTKVNFDSESNRLSVKVEYPTWNCTFCSSVQDGVELTIAVPSETNVELNGDKPDMAISSINGDIRISSEKSTIAIKSTSGAIRIGTSKGDVRLSHVAIRKELKLTSNKADAVIETESLKGDVDLETEKGSIVVRMPATVGVTLDYVGGRRATFHCDFPVTTNEKGTELRDVHGRIGRDGARINGMVNQGGARMTLRTDRGSISIEKGS